MNGKMKTCFVMCLIFGWYTIVCAQIRCHRCPNYLGVVDCTQTRWNCYSIFLGAQFKIREIRVSECTVNINLVGNRKLPFPVVRNRDGDTCPDVFTPIRESMETSPSWSSTDSTTKPARVLSNKTSGMTRTTIYQVRTETTTEATEATTKATETTTKATETTTKATETTMKATWLALSKTLDVSVDGTSMTVNPKQQTSMTANPKQQTSMTVNAKLQSDTEGEEKDAYYGFLAWGITATVFLKLSIIIIIKIRIHYTTNPQSQDEPIESNIPNQVQSPPQPTAPPQPTTPPQPKIVTPETASGENFHTPQSLKPLIRPSPVSAHTRSKMQKKS
ncbi:rho family-interacting cell polarization regulator 1-like [Saccostrea echinata]|uniref:rho family-interacting cell polarization regulator 1-like n=1 Tax=Saccostrea echinata TaxID=191078 RepID=UPI002A81834E|nr:rho family-interacting cell polarization regulator 1-like [Saccostrea echinata]